MAQTGKIAEVLFENALETYEHQEMMLGLVERFEPNSGDMQNAGNYVWRPAQQHAPIIDGWDLTGLETDIIEETYPAILGTPKNDYFSQRADDLRDMRFWERRGVESGRKQATELNRLIADAIRVQGSLFYQTNATSGYDAIAEAQAMLNERQKLKDDPRFCVLNDRDTLKYGSDLAGRQTVQGRPENTWSNGQIGANVAEFDVYTGSFLSNQAAAGTITTGTVAALVGTTPSGGQSFIPEGGSVNATTGVVTNVDYRSGTVTLTNAGTLAVGDKVTISGINSVGMADKVNSNQLMTFTVIAISGNNVTVYPKPISATLVDASATNQSLWRAYANVTGDVSAGTMATLSTNAAKSNIFGCKGAVEVTSGDAPIQLLNEFGGMKVISSSMKNGQKMYMAYDGDINDLTFRCRLFTWHAVTVADPGACGSFTTF